jgi:probable addiction module antidote protein
MTLKTKPFDVSEHLDSPEMIAAYLSAVMEEGGESDFVMAMGDVARAIGMSKISREAGLSREALYKALSEKGNPTIETMTKVFAAMGLRISVSPINEHEHA